MATSRRSLGRSPSRRRMDVADLRGLEQAYLAHHRALGHSAKTIKHYTDSFTSLHSFLADRGLPADSRVLTTTMMNEFAGWLRATPTRGWRGKTARSEFALHGTLKDLRAWCHWLVAEELIAQTPKIPVPKLPQTLFPILGEEELRRVFATKQLSPTSEIGKRNRALIAFMLDTGVRRHEAASLALADLDLKEGTAKVSGKGRKERVVFFAPATAETLKRWLAVRGDGPGLFFWLKPEGIRAVFNRIQREASLAVFHPHQLRHTCATNLLQGGADTHSVRRMLGHSSIVVTEKYLSLSTQDLKAKHTAASPYEQLAGQIVPIAQGRRRLRSA